MEETCPGLHFLMKHPWAGGVFGEMLNNGELKVGDAVRWE
jgi:hypothetical protein